MKGQRPALRLRPMRVEDIPAVVQLDRLSFATPWSTSAFRHEVLGSNHSHMLILERAGTSQRSSPHTAASAGAREQRGWRAWWRGRSQPENPTGYGGLWVIEDEGHISTLAVQPNERGQRLGELILTALIQRALAAGAGYIVLEVRVSNHVAQALYRKYDFTIAERRPRYYADSEDAFTMRLDLGDDTSIHFQKRRAALWQHFATRQGLQDAYTESPWPEACAAPG
ncbi:MAG: ribosomal protein S18-alanine N-acetyltransferase [Anaerolineaceae bacterium]|nr:ribosomal protein S18-alanine N-acetyltransferase [Anaerolineaceae bacterium]MCY4106157.1 ribosomal protein S18-alanine N-acetyltransferase [Chloroflexota bacterium]